jgi:cysteine synthase
MSPVFIFAAAGAEVVRLRPVSITHPQHPVNVARQKAADTPGAVFADQFENLANLRAHLDTGRLAVHAFGIACLLAALFAASDLIGKPVGHTLVQVGC